MSDGRKKGGLVRFLSLAPDDYDNRGRLISESRSVSRGNTPPYDMDYAYDQGGNRIVKIDNIANRRVIYTYDISAPTTYNSDNNRLMFYETYDTSATPWVPLSTTWYSYNTQGNATRVVTEPASPSLPVQATRFVYNHSQQVQYLVGEEWYRGNSDCNTYTISYAREFRYDAARARYLNRELDPALFRQGIFESVTNGDTWSDYDGDSIYGDFQVTAGTPPTVTNTRSFEPGLAQQDPQGQSSGTKYAHSDHLGTLRTQTDSGNAGLSTTTYTAFGERIDSGSYERYGYAGSWGYQAHDFPSGEGVDPIQFLHVGARYYDPASGRFLQRDPIGLLGGPNVYEYVASMPTVLVDPSGLKWTRLLVSWSGAAGGALGGAAGGAGIGALLGSILPGVGTGIGAGIGAVVGGIVGGIVGGLTGDDFSDGLINGGIAGTIAAGVAVCLPHLWVGYGSGSFVYADATGGWLIGTARMGAIRGLPWFTPAIQIPIPILFPGSVPVLGDPAARNCFWTMIKAIACGWLGQI